MKFNKAFTLIELLLVVAIASIIFAFSTPFVINFYQSQLINEAQSNIISTLERARHNAVLQKNDSDWGVKFYNDDHCFVLFASSTPDSCDPADLGIFDERYDLISNISVTNLGADNQIIFSKLTGTTATTSTTTITYGDIARGIIIADTGIVSQVSSVVAIEEDSGGCDVTCLALRTNLVAYYPFDTDTLDYSENNNDATNDGATPSSGKVGGAYTFDGSLASMDVLDDSSLDFSSTGITISSWVKTNKTSSTYYNGIFSNIYSSGTVNYFFGLGSPYSSYTLSAGFYAPGWYNFEDVTDFVDSTWVHVATTYDGHYIRIYRNGELVATSDDLNQSLPANTDGWKIGRGWDAGYWDGSLDEIAVWNHVLDSDEISQLCNNTGSGCVGRSLMP